MASTVFYLDRRNVRDGLPAPLKVSVCVNAKRFYIATGVKVFPMCWDSRAQVVFNYPDARKIMERLHDFMDSVNETLDRLNVDVLAEKLSANELRAKVEGRLGIGKKARVKDGMAPNGVWAIFNACIELKQGRTRELYELTLRKLRAFAGEEALKRLRFEDINKMWLDRFDAFMAQTAKPNARNIDLRNLRAVFNYAIDNEFTSNYPFRRFKLRYTPTRKRALSVEQLRKVIGAPCQRHTEEVLSYKL